MPSVLHFIKALKELGYSQISLYAIYQIGKRTGYWQWRTSQSKPGKWTIQLKDHLFSPEREKLLITIPNRLHLLAEAREVLNGHTKLFGQVNFPLDFTDQYNRHWTFYDHPTIEGQDIKWIWEPARLGWIFVLGRAYALESDERLSATFWEHFEVFSKNNPPYKGPQWVSAQEAGIRLLALVFAAHIFKDSDHTTTTRLQKLSQAIADHAGRIPPTLIYARAQNNNHLLLEAVALFTAGIVLPTHPQARKWKKLGWRWLNFALQTQIEPSGNYVQHSTNYHRLMLQGAMWAYMFAKQTGHRFPDKTLKRLKAATHWLLTHADPQSGHLPNLGPNDGAYLLPLSSCSYEDYRPTLQAASVLFHQRSAYERGPWDEMCLWLGEKPIQSEGDNTTLSNISTPLSPHQHQNIIRNRENQSWAYLRAAHFQTRPGHADQLHLDLWWRGQNIALDPGTYQYNTPAPWNNSLSHTAVHNTITVNNRDQMTKVGRFLFIDRAQAQIIEWSNTHLMAQHIGYRHLGIVHQRKVESQEKGWLITDNLFSQEEYRSRRQDVMFRFRLHWLLPDWAWKLEERMLQLQSPQGDISLKVDYHIPSSYCPFPNIQVVRAGEFQHGMGEDSPTRGWISPAYGVKKPALSFTIELDSNLPIRLTSEWRLPTVS